MVAGATEKQVTNLVDRIQVGLVLCVKCARSRCVDLLLQSKDERIGRIRSSNLCNVSGNGPFSQCGVAMNW